MLVATKDMSLGDYRLQAGDQITPEMEAVLPPGRMQRLEAAGWIRAAASDTLSLEQRVALLEDQVASLLQSKTRAPRAPENQE